MDGANHLQCKLQIHCTEKKLKQIFPEMKLRGLASQFLCICERFMGIFPRSVLKRNTAKQAEYIVGKYINRSLLHECRNWERGRAVSFLRNLFLDFRYSVCGYLGYLKVGPVIFSLLQFMTIFLPYLLQQYSLNGRPFTWNNVQLGISFSCKQSLKVLKGAKSG